MTRPQQLLLLSLIITVSLHTSPAQNRQAPPFLIDEIFRLTKQCYFFQEYATLKQKNRWYVLATFLSREAVQSPCGPKLPQVRLYRLVNDTTVAFSDSVLINSYSASLGVASDWDNSGLYKLLVQHACNPPQSSLPPLLCYALSVFEITGKAKFRNLIRLGDVPERWKDEHSAGIPLEPVVTEHLDKTQYPELLAIDDFFEGDPAFRADDFPKVTLIYAWDPKAKVFKNASEKFPHRFQPPSEIVSMPNNTKLVTVVEKVLMLAAVKRFDDAKKLMDLNMAPDRFSLWRAEAPERGAAISPERLKEKLTRCITRYK